MKKIISVLLCLTLLCALAVPAAHAADVPDAYMEAYADTDRGFVLVLTMDECVTGVSDAFSVRIQKLQRNKEKLGYDIAPEQIVVVPPRADDNLLQIYLFEFDRRECDHVRVEGLLTQDGEKTLVQRFWSEKQRLNALDRTGFMGLVEPYWKDETITLGHKDDDFDDSLFMAHKEEIICTPGNQLGLWKSFNHPAPSPSSGFQIDSDILTPNEDGTIAVNAVSSCTVHAVFSEQIAYTWKVRVVNEEELREICLQAAKSNPLFYMEYYIGAAAVLFSLPPLTVTLPLIIPLAALTAPAAYVAYLAYLRFSNKL